MLEFCPVCRGLLQIKKEGEKTIGICKCGFRRSLGIEIVSFDKSITSKIRETGVVENLSKSEGEGIIHVCKKCGNTTSEVSEIAANESVIFIYKCLKCGNSERQIQGSSKF